jgi:hypothetical protein
MRNNLTRNDRQQFLVSAVEVAKNAGARGVVVVEDATARPANRGLTPVQDVTTLLLERIESYFQGAGSDGIVIVDRPGGDRRAEDAYLLDFLDTLEVGTAYVKPQRIALNVLSANSRFTRLLQLADVVTSCTTAIVAGEATFSPPVFDPIRELLLEEGGRIGGVGLKIHPDYKYVNLYHWLLGDEYLRRGSLGTPLPMDGHRYSSSPFG